MGISNGIIVLNNNNNKKKTMGNINKLRNFTHKTRNIKITSYFCFTTALLDYTAKNIIFE